MKNYNQIQKDLVRICEEAHYHGVRHKGLSGALCEDALIRVLKEEFPNLGINRGVIKFDSSKLGNDLKTQDLSTQFDIVIYKNKPFYISEGVVVIERQNTLAVIEVKKWIHPNENSRADNLIRNNKKVKNILGDIPLFLVAYRAYTPLDLYIWNHRFIKYGVDDVFIFFGNYSSEKGKNFYPWEEKIWENFEKSPFAGELERLIGSINNLNK